MQEHEQTIVRNRYPGVKPFLTEEQDLFFGRERDVEDLYALLAIKQIVVLYGKSGYGKSSLINAGMIPKLKEDPSWAYFPIRFTNYSRHEKSENFTPIENIKLRLNNEIRGTADSPLNRLIPDEDSFWYWIKTYQYLRKCSRFVLFFDQFEELFTYPAAQVEEFSEQLSQLLYSTIPPKFRQRISELDAADEISDDLNAFLYDKPEVKVVFAVRADRLSQLNALTERHPTVLQNCYELDALTMEQAKKAIIEPASLSNNQHYLTGEFSYDPVAVDVILQNVANQQDGKIELATLQIVCRFVEDELVRARRNKRITTSLLGDIKGVFKQHYESIIGRLDPDDRQKAQHLIEDELLDGGQRNPLSEAYIKSKFGISDDLLQKLEATSLLRKELDAKGRMLMELGHDALIIPISEAKRKRIETEEVERLNQEREAKKMLDDQITQLRKARELGGLDKKGFELIKHDTVKRQHALFLIDSRVKAARILIQRGYRTMLIVAFWVFIIVWAVVATSKLQAKKESINKRSKRLEVLNGHLEKYIEDSLSRAPDNRSLEDLLRQYRALQEH